MSVQQGAAGVRSTVRLQNMGFFAFFSGASGGMTGLPARSLQRPNTALAGTASRRCHPPLMPRLSVTPRLLR